MADGFVLSEADVRAIRSLIGEARQRRVNTTGRPGVPTQVPEAPELYVARTPAAGIPPIDLGGDGIGTGDEPGSADCYVYQLNPDGELRPVPGVFRKVYSLLFTTIPGNQWIIIARDKFGAWWALPGDVAEAGCCCEYGYLETTSSTTVDIPAGRPSALIGTPATAAVYNLPDPGDIPFGDAVDHVSVDAGGSGYTSAPTVTFSAPGAGVTATGIAAIADGAVESVTITEPGSGYTSAPTVAFSGGGGSGASATATLTGICWRSIVVNLGASAIRFVPPGSVTIHGQAYFDLFPTQSVRILCDRTNYEVEAGRQGLTPRTVSTSTASLTAADHNRHVTYTGTAASTWTLAADTERADYATYLSNSTGTKTVKLQHATKNIDGQASVYLYPGQGLILTYNATTGDYRTIQGRTVWTGENEPGTAFSIDEEHNYHLIHCTAPSGDVAVTYDSTLPANHTSQLVNLTSEGLVTVTATGTGAHIRLPVGHGTFLVHNGDPDGQPWENPGRFLLPTAQYTAGATVSYAKAFWLHTWNVSSDASVNLANNLRYQGGKVTVASNRQSNAFVTINAPSPGLEGQTTAAQVLMPGQSVGIRGTDSDGLFAERGCHQRPYIQVTATTRALRPDDFAGALNLEGLAVTEVSLPSDFPRGHYFDVINSLSTDDHATVEDNDGNVLSIPHLQGVAAFTDGAGRLHYNPGLTLSGLVPVEDADFTATINHQMRMVGVAATSANRTVSMDDTTDAVTFAFAVGSLYGNTHFVRVDPPAGGTFADGFTPFMAHFSSVLFFGDGGGEWQMFAGMYIAPIFTHGDGFTSDEETLDATAHRSHFQLRGALDVTLIHPSGWPAGQQYSVSNPQVDGIKKGVIVAPNGDEYWMGGNRGVWVFPEGGDETSSMNVCPGDFSVFGYTHSGSATVVYAQKGSVHYFLLSGNETLTLAADCAHASFHIGVTVGEEGDEDATLTISAPADILGLPGGTLLHCDGGTITWSEDAEAFIFQAGRVCCNVCAIITTKGDLLTYDGALETLVRLPVGSDGQILYADSGTDTGLSWDDPPGSGAVTSFTDPFYGTWVITAGDAEFTWSAVNANYFWAGPTSGSPATPTFRAVVAADLGTGSSGTGTLVLKDNLTWGSMSSVLDGISSTQGTILYRGSGAWAALAPSATAGMPLISNGTGANPSYGQVAPAGLQHTPFLGFNLN